MSGMAVFFFFVGLILVPLLSAGTSSSSPWSLLPACTAVSTCSSPLIFSVDDDDDVECTLLLFKLSNQDDTMKELQLLVPTTHGPIHRSIGKSPPWSTSVEMDADDLGAVEEEEKLPFILGSGSDGNKEHLRDAPAGQGAVMAWKKATLVELLMVLSTTEIDIKLKTVFQSLDKWMLSKGLPKPVPLVVADDNIDYTALNSKKQFQDTSVAISTKGQGVVMAWKKATLVELLMVFSTAAVAMKVKTVAPPQKVLIITASILLVLITSVPRVSSVDFARINFDVTKNEYQTFFDELRRELTDGTQPIKDHYILPEEVKGAPPKWINVALVGEGKNEATLYFRSDSLYLIMFANKEAEVFYMDTFNEEGKFPNEEIVPPGTIRLPFSENYTSLTNKPYGSKVDTASLLESVALGKSSALVAISALSNYQHGVSSIEPIKKAILAFCFMIAEAQRIREIGTKCRDNWLVTTYVTKTEAEYALVWGRLSKLWCLGRLGNKFTKIRTNLGIQSIDQVGNILDLVKKDKGEFCETEQGQC